MTARAGRRGRRPSSGGSARFFIRKVRGDVHGRTWADLLSAVAQHLGPGTSFTKAVGVATKSFGISPDGFRKQVPNEKAFIERLNELTRSIERESDQVRSGAVGASSKEREFIARAQQVRDELLRLPARLRNDLSLADADVHRVEARVHEALRHVSTDVAQAGIARRVLAVGLSPELPSVVDQILKSLQRDELTLSERSDSVETLRLIFSIHGLGEK